MRTMLCLLLAILVPGCAAQEEDNGLRNASVATFDSAYVAAFPNALDVPTTWQYWGIDPDSPKFRVLREQFLTKRFARAVIAKGAATSNPSPPSSESSTVLLRVNIAPEGFIVIRPTRSQIEFVVHESGNDLSAMRAGFTYPDQSLFETHVVEWDAELRALYDAITAGK